MRHTACTRMAECRMDVKVLQYIMGHAHIDVTMEVYNHIGELTRIENEDGDRKRERYFRYFLCSAVSL